MDLFDTLPPGSDEIVALTEVLEKVKEGDVHQKWCVGMGRRRISTASSSIRRPQAMQCACLAIPTS